MMDGASKRWDAMRATMTWGKSGRLAAKSDTVMASALAALTAMSFSMFALSSAISAKVIAAVMERISSPSASRNAGRRACIRVGDRL